MPRIILTKATIDLLEAHSLGGLGFAVKPDPVDEEHWAIQVDQEVYDRLEMIDKSPDEAIRMLCSGQLGRA